jgi:hypothetical protein
VAATLRFEGFDYGSMQCSKSCPVIKGTPKPLVQFKIPWSLLAPKTTRPALLIKPPAAREDFAGNPSIPLFYKLANPTLVSSKSSSASILGHAHNAIK